MAKRFRLISESDARKIPAGSTVELPRSSKISSLLDATGGARQRPASRRRVLRRERSVAAFLLNRWLHSARPPRAKGRVMASFRTALALGLVTTLAGCNLLSSRTSNELGKLQYQRGNYTAARWDFQRAVVEDRRLRQDAADAPDQSLLFPHSRQRRQAGGGVARLGGSVLL